MKLFEKLFGSKPPDSARNLGRNDPCWCGSGKKYKRCHLDADQRYFSSKLAATHCTTSG